MRTSYPESVPFLRGIYPLTPFKNLFPRNPCQGVGYPSGAPDPLSGGIPGWSREILLSGSQDPLLAPCGVPDSQRSPLPSPSSFASALSLGLPRSVCRGQFFSRLGVPVVFAGEREETWGGVRSGWESHCCDPQSPTSCGGLAPLWEALATSLNTDLQNTCSRRQLRPDLAALSQQSPGVDRLSPDQLCKPRLSRHRARQEGAPVALPFPCGSRKIRSGLTLRSPGPSHSLVASFRH